MVTAKQIDADILCGAAAIYLLLGVAWAVTYWMIYELDKHAFTAIAAQKSGPRQDRHTFCRHRQGADRKFLAEPKRRIGDEPVHRLQLIR